MATDIIYAHDSLSDSIKKINVNTDTVLWDKNFHSNMIKDMVVDSEGNLISTSQDGTVKKIDSDGNELWSYTRTGLGCYSVVVNSNDDIYFDDGGDVTKLNSAGNFQWTMNVPNTEAWALVIDSNDRLIVGCMSGWVFKPSEDDGSWISRDWNNYDIDTRISEIMADSNNDIFVVRSDGLIRKINGLTGAGSAWNGLTTGGGNEYRKVVLDIDDNLYIAVDEEVRKIDSSNVIQWTATIFSAGSDIYDITIDEDGYPYIGGRDGLRKLDPLDGGILWTFATDDRSRALAHYRIAVSVPISNIYASSSVKGNLRGKAAEGFIRPTIKQFFTSTDFEEIISHIVKGYIFSGASTATSDCDEYSAGLDTWTGKTDLINDRENSSAVSTIYQKGYLYGGFAGLSKCDEYNPDTWTSKADIPAGRGRAYLAASTIINKGYIFGGSGSSSYVDEYVPDVWTSKTDMPAPGRYYLASSTINSKGYIYGGFIPLRADCDEYTPDTWASKTDMPGIGRRDHTATTILSKGYIFGGYEDNGATADCIEYSPDTWTSKADLLAAVGRFAASTLDDKGYIYGGLQTSNACNEYNSVSNSWTSKTSIPSPGRHSHSGCSI